jgi:hypothetical protein
VVVVRAVAMVLFVGRALNASIKSLYCRTCKCMGGEKKGESEKKWFVFLSLLFHNSIHWMTQSPPGKEKKLRTLPVDIYMGERRRERVQRRDFP